MPQIPLTVRNPLDKPLVLVETVTLTPPAAGAEFFYTFPANQRTQIMALALQLVTDANLPTRHFRFILSSPNGPIFRSNQVANINDSVTRYCTLAPGIAYFTGSDASPFALIALPPGIVCFEGFTLETITDNIQVGDQYGGIAAQMLTQIESD